MARMLHRVHTATLTHARKVAGIARRHGLVPKLYKGGLGHYVSITVPSTKDRTKPVSAATFRRRTREVERYLSRRFGGETTVPGYGGYFLKRGRF